MTKYHRYYYALIENARNRILPSNTYKESHHIIPRSLGGSNDKNNLIDLTAREHYIAHLLLAKMYGGEQKRKMLAAIVLMGAIKRYKTKCNSHLYESMRLSYIKTVKGKSRDIEVREKHRLLSEELKEYNGYTPSVESMKMLNDILYGHMVKTRT
jgi:hypothetical protein